jgi:hypothetical protein
MSHRQHPRDDRASATTIAAANTPLSAALDALRKGSSSRRRRLRRLAAPAAAIAITGGLSPFAAPAEAATVPTATVSSGTLSVVGTAARDTADIVVNGSFVTVDFGIDGTVDARFARSQVQQIHVQLFGGNDGVAVTGTGQVPVTVSGGAGSDGIGVVGDIGSSGDGDAPTTISGNDGNDSLFAATPGQVTVLGGGGDDNVDGGGAAVGQERIALGGGNDVFLSELNTFVGARRDTVDGGTGVDRLDLQGTFASESLSLSANAGQLVVVDDRAHVDSDNVENVTFKGFGGLDGGDSVAVNDLSGTDVVRFTPDFSAPQDPTSPNNSDDQLTVRGTDKVDTITVSGTGANITVSGLTPLVTPVFLQSPDVLRIDTLAGADVVDSSGLARNLVQLQVF